MWISRGLPREDRRLVNVIHIAGKHKTPSLFLALDAEKAFDRIHWQFLSQVLGKYAFRGPTYSAIMVLYTHPSAQVFTSGALSTPSTITNGTRQGCPLSPLIFFLFTNGTTNHPPENTSAHL